MRSRDFELDLVRGGGSLVIRWPSSSAPESFTSDGTDHVVNDPPHSPACPTGIVRPYTSSSVTPHGASLGSSRTCAPRLTLLVDSIAALLVTLHNVAWSQQWLVRERCDRRAAVWTRDSCAACWSACLSFVVPTSPSQVLCQTPVCNTSICANSGDCRRCICGIVATADKT